MTGLVPRFTIAELTLADSTPAMAALRPLAAESLAAAERAVDSSGGRSPRSATRNCDALARRMIE
jgi:hypothetical protein